MSSTTPSRLIPARAGNTSACAAWAASRTAHPRSRGEHDTKTSGEVPRSGSSPLARGTLRGLVRFECYRRLIPARAGNTMMRHVSPNARPAHPRSRGEHSLVCWFVWLFAGSSPLARGTPQTRKAPQMPERLIPARAGNTGANVVGAVNSAAHPRSRGEHMRRSPGRGTVSGSSPLARGTLGTHGGAG